jgi:hypothetical protein
MPIEQAVVYIALAVALLLTILSIAQCFNSVFHFSKNRLFRPRTFFLFLHATKNKPWGVVYDSVTKQPIDPAVVTIVVDESGVGEFKQSRVTDIEGRFSFLVTAGKYIISAEKTHYLFPSKIVKGETDGKYKNVYHGEVIEVENPYIINLNIPMDPEGFDWNQSIKPKEINALREYVHENARNILLLAGFTLMVIAYLLSQNIWYLGIGIVYAINALFWKTQKDEQLWGTVFYRITKEPLARVTVKAIRKPYDLTVGTTTTDLLGRYFLLLSKGKYTIQVEKTEKGKKPEILKQIDNIEVTKDKEVIDFDIGV